ncbi:hypothetical protein IQ216_00095 [Cyanobium sp. LEGE 06143]|uniref:hypothetical protein n=1 Tax=Cyanobium sp. LEGE 06143 TaxID=945727 RepID=UPI001882E883|nr:hypothetical protein [Cyanobium sp. LEGE 06143]MBE9171547.1 hypothetical protein [Cyanobium sp. LEGE 06143]
MPFNSLLLPLAGGFLFISFWNKTKYNANRSNGQRLILESALWGMLFLGIAYFIIRLLNWMLPAFYPIWHYWIPYPQLGPPIGSLLIGSCLPCILNRFWSEKKENAISYEAFSDYIGLVFFRAQTNRKPVMITLRNGKVYIGFIRGCNCPGNHDGGGSLYMQPSMSGYRREETHEMHLTTDYTAILQSIAASVEEEQARLDAMAKSNAKNKIEVQQELRERLKEVKTAALERLDVLYMAISVSDIVSAGIFNKSAYKQFNPMFKEPLKNPIESA